MNERLLNAFNRQMNRELYSGYLYLSMASWLDERKLPGFANWMKKQAAEEAKHAMRLYEHVVSRGKRPVMTSIETPESDWDSEQAIAEAVLAHEKKVTGMINELMALVKSEGDEDDVECLEWFVEEQEEEEESAQNLISRVEPAHDDPSKMREVDKELNER